MNTPRGPAVRSMSGQKSLMWPRLVQRLGSSGSPPSNRFQEAPPDQDVPAMMRPSGNVATSARCAPGLEPSASMWKRRSGTPKAALASRIPVCPGTPACHASTDCPSGASVIVSARPTSAALNPAGTKLAPPSDEYASHSLFVSRATAISTPSLSRRRIHTCSKSSRSVSAVRMSQAVAPRGSRQYWGAPNVSGRNRMWDVPAGSTTTLGLVPTPRSTGVTAACAGAAATKDVARARNRDRSRLISNTHASCPPGRFPA